MGRLVFADCPSVQAKAIYKGGVTRRTPSSFLWLNSLREALRENVILCFGLVGALAYVPLACVKVSSWTGPWAQRLCYTAEGEVQWD